jgi:Flp pilus assembly pilin Flp
VGSIPLTHREDGQTMAEYAVVLAVITPALILVFATMADAIVARLQTVVGFLT